MRAFSCWRNSVPASVVRIAIRFKVQRHTNMKELRTQCQGRPLRTFFAFDPRRTAILLIGGDKTGDKRFYERMIPLAERLYNNYLEELRREGLL